VTGHVWPKRKKGHMQGLAHFAFFLFFFYKESKQPFKKKSDVSSILLVIDH